MSLLENYVDTVRRETGMFALYPPNQRIRLGDFGVVRDGRFIRHGNIHDLDPSVPVQELVGAVKMNREFKSRKVRKTVIGAGASGSASGASARARLELDFGAESSVYFAVAGCTHKQLGNLGRVANAIVQRSKASQWNDEYRVVTALVESENTTVVLAREESSRVVLEADTELPAMIDMADAKLSLRLTFDSAASENWVTVKPEASGQPLTPFCWFHHIDRDFFGNRPTFDPTAESARAAIAPEQSFVPVEADRLRGWNREQNR
jgi:hypothetical protein